MSVEQALRKARSLARKGEVSEARAIYQSVLDRFPENKRAMEGLQTLAGPMPVRRKRIPLTQEEANGLVALYRQGHFRQALSQGLALATLHPETAFLHNIVGVCHAALGQGEEAAASYRRALKLKPDAPDVLNNLGAALNDLSRHEEAEGSLRRALALRPDYAEALNNLGNALNHQNRQAEAAPVLEKAIALKPGFAEALNNLGNAHNDLGRRDEAIARYEEAVKSRPGYAEAWRNLSVVKRFLPGDPAIGELESALASASAPTAKVHLELALAKVLDDLGETELAFAHFEKGNNLHRRDVGARMEDQNRLFNRIRAAFENGVPMPPPDLAPACKRQVFILGMPRSGTSLVEQILASHPAVHGGGELQAMRLAVAPLLETGATDAAALAAVRKSYLGSLDALEVGEPVVTDKMPLNFRWIGYIAAALPEAAIIHVRRNPVAVGWSLYKTFFPARGLEFTFDLGDIAAYYRLYEELMEFWRDRLPGRFHELDYERLTENQEEETRCLLDHCGFEWDERCLAFHETARPVRTASSAQVREKMYRGSSKAWRRYERQLAPLIKALAPKDRDGDRGAEGFAAPPRGAGISGSG